MLQSKLFNFMFYLKWVVVYCSVMFYINGQHRESSAPCLYTVTGWGVMSCVCGMPFAMWQHIGQSTTATSRHRPDMTLNNKQGRAAHGNND